MFLFGPHPPVWIFFLVGTSPKVITQYDNEVIHLICFFQNKIQGFFFDVAISTKFELAIVVLILLNMCAMAVEHYRQAEIFKYKTKLCVTPFSSENA